jgi:hypothetical protein
MRFVCFIGVLLSCLAAVCRAQTERSRPAPKVFEPDWSLRGDSLNKTLARLAAQQGVDPQDYLYHREPRVSGLPDGLGTYWRQSRAIKLRADDEQVLLVVQQGGGEVTLGSVYLQLVLLSTQGRLLDRLECVASARRVAALECEIPTDGQAAGAQAIIRFEPLRRGSDNWYHGRHSITLRGVEYNFYERDETGKSDEARVWRHQGLCRIKVFHGKLFVLFPRIVNPQARLAEARAMRIAYSVGGMQKSLIIEDRGRIAILVSKMSVLATTNYFLMRTAYGGDTIQFFMPDGTVDALGFISPTVLCGGDWHKIEVRSRDFYDRLCDFVSEAEGKRITLPAGDKQTEEKY